MARFWNFIKNAATDTTPESVELRIEGDIVDDDEAWIYEWFGMKATSPNAFREELKQYSGQDLTIWIDSYGGSVFAAGGIYNALKEHKGKKTAKVTKAMSAASVIAMAADEILMSPVGIMMIHNPLTSSYGYASDMRKMADVLDEVKETIVNAYQMKTKRSRNKISTMMDDESYMSAKTAVKEGFADNILYTDSENVNDVQDFAFNRLAIQNSASDAIKHFLNFKEKHKQELEPENQPGDNTKADILKAKMALELEL